ncbi:GWxTD domain-containing protein [candidate division KSB1 bacterium]|nr:GWxTD domain-containing protein [candidate division KSB1 bacterium]
MYKIHKLMFILLTIVLSGSVSAQPDIKHLKPFDYDIITRPLDTEGKTLTNVYVWVRNTHLQFIKNDLIYSAHYQINVDIAPENKPAILTRDRHNIVTEQEYPATIDPSNQRGHQFEAELAPGKYIFNLRILDKNTGRDRIHTIKKEIKDFESGNIVLSDLLLLNSSDLENVSVDNVVPPRRIPIKNELYLYAEISSPLSVERMGIDVFFTQDGNTRKLEVSDSLFRTGDVTKVVMNLNKDNLKLGNNILMIRVSSGDESSEIRKRVRFIQFEGTDQEYASDSVDDMINQLRYVAEGDEWDALRKAEGEEQQRLFDTFWKKRDPTPETPDNPIKEEYYRRVQIANQRFGIQKQSGWRSDRGHVFIIYGPPDSIDRGNPSQYSFSTYEVWYYDQLRKRFIFVDEMGFGDYRLVSGII